MSPERYPQILRASGSVEETFSATRRLAVLHAWREVYAAALHADKGEWQYLGYDWHLFSYRYARALSGEEAAREYARQEPCVVVVCPEEDELPAVRLSCRVLPDFRSSGEDVHVWREDLSWTMAFTHEEDAGLGPYFGRREWLLQGRKTVSGPELSR